MFQGKFVHTRLELKLQQAEALVEKIDSISVILVTNMGGLSTYEYQSTVRRKLNELLTLLIGKGTEEDLQVFQKLLGQRLDTKTFTPIFFGEKLVTCWETVIKVEKLHRIKLFPNDYIRDFAAGLIEASKK